MKIASHKHNLMTSSSVGSDHPGKYSNKLPHEYFSVFHKFYMVHSWILCPICCHFLKTALFLEKLLLHASSEWQSQRNNYFFGEVISSGQLIFLRSSFFRIVTYLQQLFFRNSYVFRAKLLPNSHLMRIGSSLGQLLFRIGIFLKRSSSEK